MKRLYDAHFHLGIVRGDPEWRGIKQHLFSDELYLVDTSIQTLEEIRQSTKPFIEFKSDSTYYQQIQNWWHRQFDNGPNRTIVVDQIETCKQLAINGIGFAILPSISLTDDDQVYKIPLTDDRGYPLKRETWLLSDKASQELKQVKAFINMLS